MKKLMKLVRATIANPTFRLAARAVVVAVTAALTQIHSADGGTIAWRSIVVGAVIAFCEVFTPLNQLVGLFKLLGSQAGGKPKAVPAEVEDANVVPDPVVEPEPAPERPKRPRARASSPKKKQGGGKQGGTKSKGAGGSRKKS